MTPKELFGIGLISSIQAMGVVAVKKAVTLLGHTFIQLDPKIMALSGTIGLIHGIATSCLIFFSVSIGIEKIIDPYNHIFLFVFAPSLLSAGSLGILLQTAAKTNLSVAGILTLSLMYPVSYFLGDAILSFDP